MPIRVSYSQLGLIYSLALLSLLNASHNNSIVSSILAFIGYLVLLIIWKRTFLLHDVHPNWQLSQIIIITLIALPFPIFYNQTFIQSLWDSFLSSNGIHPYLFTPSNEAIGLGKTSLLFDFLWEKHELSSISPAIQILIQPIYILYSKTNLITALLSTKFILSACFFLALNKLRDDEITNKWLFLPAIWIFGIAQANPELFGLILFLWAYSFYLKDDFVTSSAVFGVSSLFGLPFFMASLILIAKTKDWKNLGVSLFSSAIWISIIWDPQGLFNWAFISSWNHSISALFLSNLSKPYLGSFVSIGLILCTSTLAFSKFREHFLLILMIAFALLFPLNTATLWGLSIFLIDFDTQKKTDSNLIPSAVIFSIYSLILLTIKLL